MTTAPGPEGLLIFKCDDTENQNLYLLYLDGTGNLKYYYANKDNPHTPYVYIPLSTEGSGFNTLKSTNSLFHLEEGSFVRGTGGNGLFEALKGLQHLDFKNLDVSEMTHMDRMFKDIDPKPNYNTLDALTDLKYWDTSKVVSMQNTFSGKGKWSDKYNAIAGFWDGDAIANWDVSSVKTMKNIFFSNWGFKGDLSNWNIASLESMEYVFHYCRGNITGLGSWDVSKIKNFSHCFSEFTNNFFDDRSVYIDAGTGSWDVSAAENFTRIFYSGTFNDDVSGWRPCSVNNLTDGNNPDNFLNYNSTFDQDLSEWRLWVKKPNYFGYQEYQKDYERHPWWATQCEFKSNTPPGPGGLLRLKLKASTPTTHETPISVTYHKVREPDTGRTFDAVYYYFHHYKDNIIEIPLSGIDEELVSGSERANSITVTYYVDAEVMPGSFIKGNGGVNLFARLTSYLKLNNLQNIDTSQATSLARCFYNSSADFTNAKFNGYGSWDTSNVTSLREAFSDTSKDGVGDNVVSWDVSNVKNFNSTFKSCSKFNADISQWRMCKAEDVDYMLYSCREFAHDLSGWQIPLISRKPTYFDYSVSYLTSNKQYQPQWGVECDPIGYYFAVQRGNQTFSCESKVLNSKLVDGDLLLVQRDGVDYAYTVNLTELRK